MKYSSLFEPDNLRLRRAKGLAYTRNPSSLLNAMLTSPLSHLLEAFDNVDQQGFLEFTVPSQRLSHLQVKARADIARALLSSFFADQYLVMVQVDLVKSFIDEVLVDMHLRDDQNWVLKINFPRLMLLPGESPAEELMELRRLFEEIRSLIALAPNSVGTAVIHNERGPDKRVFGRIKFVYSNIPSDIASSPTLAPTEEANQRLQALVESSPLIQRYLRNVALALGTMGPHSSTWIGERQLYGVANGPWLDAFLASLPGKNNGASGAIP